MINVVIVAGGLGSRLAPLTNHIPKFLVNIGKNTGYVEQVRYWQQYTEFRIPEDVVEDLGDDAYNTIEPGSLTVIVHSNYEDLIRAYHAMYFPKIPLIVKTVDEANGSAHAILSTCDHLNGKPVFFQWCDVMPGEDIPAGEMVEHYHGKNVVFTNYDHPNRYGLVKKGTGWADVKPQLREDGRGGIFGLYYVNNFTTNVMYVDGQDFVDVLEQYGEMREHRLSSIVDWGDKPKLERTRDTADAAREFNKVEFHGDLVLKSALNEQGETLIKREIKWYNELLTLGLDVQRPVFWPHPTESSFVMSRVQGVPVFQFWKTLDAENRGLVLERVFDQMDELHRIHQSGMSHTLADHIRDVKIEAHDKLLSRYAEIENVVKAFGEVHTVNGQRLTETDPRKIISALYAELVDLYDNDDTRYSVIHGDMQMSNTMINPDTMEVSLIDPRGYFGKSEVYGLADYDIAKMYYSLTGYDLFNYSRDFGIKSLKDGVIEFDIPKPDVTGCEEIMEARFKHAHRLWLAVIWLGLAGYIKNDPVKSVCAHYHGLAMAERVLNSLKP